MLPSYLTMRRKRAVVSHLAITVADLERAAAFYSEVFGLERAASPYEGRGRRLSAVMEVEDAQLEGLFLGDGHVFLELLRYESGFRGRPLPHRDDELGYAHLSFLVDDVDEVGALVEQHGGELRGTTRAEFPFGDGAPTVIAFCTDPDGNRIELIEHRDAAGRAAHAAFLQAGGIGWPPPEAPAPWT